MPHVALTPPLHLLRTEAREIAVEHVRWAQKHGGYRKAICIELGVPYQRSVRWSTIENHIVEWLEERSSDQARAA